MALQDGGNVLWPIFAAAHIPHRCRIPGLEQTTNNDNNYDYNSYDDTSFDISNISMKNYERQELQNVPHQLIQQTFFQGNKHFAKIRKFD